MLSSYTLLFKEDETGPEALSENFNVDDPDDDTTVFHAVTKTTGERVVIKRSRNNKEKILIENELKILSEISHPGIVKMIDHFNHLDNLILVTKNAGSSLFSLILQNALSETRRKKILKQVVETLSYLHSLNMVHGDLKTDNIVIGPEDTVTLIDFANSGVPVLGLPGANKHGTIPTGFFGMLEATAPEMATHWLDYCYLGWCEYTLACDIWASGVVIYETMTGKLPFEGVTYRHTIKLINNVTYTQPEDPILADLLGKILVWNPTHRPTCTQILQHSFFDTLSVFP